MTRGALAVLTVSTISGAEQLSMRYCSVSVEMLVSAITSAELLMALMRASRNSGVMHETISVSATAAIMSPVRSLTQRYRPFRMPSQRSLSERSSPMAWHSRQHISPKVSPPNALTNFTSWPISRRLWAMLRATPPQPRVTCPGTESAGTNGAVNAAEMSMFTPPITVTYSSISFRYYFPSKNKSGWSRRFAQQVSLWPSPVNTRLW